MTVTQDMDVLDDVPHSGEEPLNGASVRRWLGLLDEAELAKFLAVDTRTIHRWRAEGRGPAFIKAGNAVLFRLPDIREWLDQRVERTAELKFASPRSRCASNRSR